MCAAMVTETDGSSPPAAESGRRFQVADATILVAAAAVGLGVMISVARAGKHSPNDWFAALIEKTRWDDLMADCDKAVKLGLLTMPVVVSITLALVPIRLMGTRPRFRRLMCQPGLTASGASGLAIALVVFPVLVGSPTIGAGWGGVARILVDERKILWTTMYGGAAVLASWLTLIVGGRWCAERSWNDRLGRVLGFVWIVAGSAIWTAILFFGWPSSRCYWDSATPLWSIEGVGREVLQFTTLAMPPVAMATLVLLPIRLVDTRLWFRRHARQPGLIALCATGLVMALLPLHLVMMQLFVDFNPSWVNFLHRPKLILDEAIADSVTRYGGLAVLASWTTLLVAEQWRSARSWGERLGRIVGLCWILLAFAVVSGEALIEIRHDRSRQLEQNGP